MKTRIVATVVAAACALAVVASVLLGLAYNGTIANPPDDSGSSVEQGSIPVTRPTETETASPSSELPLPTVADIPSTMATELRGGAVEWLEDQVIIDRCMQEAGFPEYRYAAAWQPGWTPDAINRWEKDMSAARLDAAQLALNGNPGSGADYHWEDAGCSGYAIEMGGSDSAN